MRFVFRELVKTDVGDVGECFSGTRRWRQRLVDIWVRIGENEKPALVDLSKNSRRWKSDKVAS
jgi:hypothetical protein